MGVITFIRKDHGHVVIPKNYIFTQNVLENAFIGTCFRYTLSSQKRLFHNCTLLARPKNIIRI